MIVPIHTEFLSKPCILIGLDWSYSSVCSAKLLRWKWQTDIDGVSQTIHHPINTVEEQLW